MIKTLCALAAMLCLSSCATIYSGGTYNLTVTTNAQNAKAKVNDEVKPLPAEFRVPHSTEDLHITLTTDSLRREYIVPARLRPLSVIGNIIWGIGYPLGRYIDAKSGKGYYYGNRLFLDGNRAQAEAPGFEGLKVNYHDTEKGRVNIIFSIPYANLFYLNPRIEGAVSSAGFLGISAGAEYYYKNNRYLKLNASGIIDFPIFIPVPLDSDGIDKRSYSASLALTDNFVWNRFTVGYGVTFAKNKWIYDNDGGDPNNPLVPGAIEHMELSTISTGLQVNGYFRVGTTFNIGAIYNPYLYDFAPSGKFNYQHTISIDLLWKIKI